LDSAHTPVTDKEPATSSPPAAQPAQATGTVPDVRLERLTKRFDDVIAVNDISLEIERGHFFALLGPSGCGKTTTLRMIGGFEEPTAGRIYLGDQDVGKLPSYKRDVNTVFQSYALFPHLSIFENVAFGLRRRGIKSDELTRRTLEALELVGLSGLEKRRPRQLSGGQQQRIALARALVNRPRVLLLDEPLGALDLKLRKQMQLELKRIQHEVGITFIHVTHDQEEAMTMADQIVVMNGGRIEQIGSPAELYERPTTAFVAGFLGVSNLLTGTVAGPERVALDGGIEIAVPQQTLAGRTGKVAVGIRPEKIRIGEADRNQLAGTVRESAYIGVSTQYIVETTAGAVSIYVQNERSGATSLGVGEQLTLSWSPESTFVVDPPEASA
jgi:spermidine/putrescine transport system ATP-binding protein